MMDQRMRNDLDNYITGHYGEDQFRQPRKRVVRRKSAHNSQSLAICASCCDRASCEMYLNYPDGLIACSKQRKRAGI